MPQVLTQKGFKKFDKAISNLNKEKKLKISLSNGKNINCTKDHRFLSKNGKFIFAKNLVCGKKLHNDVEILSIEEYESIELVYDLLNVKDTHSYYTNSIISHNCVLLDEFSHVPNNMATDFFNSVYPVISSGKKTKIIITSTPFGMNLYYKIWTDAVAGRNGYFPFSIHWSMVPGRDEKWKEETIRNTSLAQFTQEFECEFLGSSNTLINASKLQMLAYKEAVEIVDINGEKAFHVFIPPVKGDNEKVKDHLYAMTVDTAEGKNLDASAFSIFDVSVVPYVQVARYSSPTIPPLIFPTVIVNAAKYYNDAYVLVETNNNPQIPSIIHEELEYENLLKVQTGNKKAQEVSAGFGRGIQLGVRMSPIVKRVGCLNLKTLIEEDKLLINDFETISELTSFISEGTTWHADDGHNDDICMTLILFAWLSTQKYFRDIVQNDLRKQLQFEKLNQLEEELVPGPMFDTGIDVPFVIEDGDMWVSKENQEEYDRYFRVQ